MTILTLLVKASNASQLRQVGDLLSAEFEELDVEAKVLGNPINKWVQVSLSGEDETIATNYINKKIGTCPTTLENAKNQSVLNGYISKVDQNKQELKVDVGIFEPKAIQASVPLPRLQAQLAESKEVAFKKIVEAFGLAEGLPLSVKVIGEEAEGLGAELSAQQVEKLQGWQQSLLDRLIILGASRDTVDSVLERTRLERDVIDVEALGFFEHALTCKLGTDAAGVIPRIGGYLKHSVLVVFSAKKSVSFLG
jgi:hypothetical protein